MTTTAMRLEPPRPSFFNDPAVRGVIYQIIVAAAVVALFTFIISNAAQNLIVQRKTMGFDFLNHVAGYDIFFKLIPYDRSSSYWAAFAVGLLNTLLVASIGIVFCTVWGFILGIARLSQNLIVSWLATIYIETLRNIPLLLQLFFWYFAVLKAMPAVKQSYVFLGDFILNKRGLYIPWPIFDQRFVWTPIAFVLGIVAALAIRAWGRRRLEATGQRVPSGWIGIAIVVVLPVLVYFVSGADLEFSIPKIKGFNFEGGVGLPPELVALVMGLSLYTATYVAEIVRAGILAVNKGQSEAAASLGLRDGDRLRLVIIPQAMRVIIPPLTSQYLNLTKNSSLGAAIGFPELVNVFAGTALNQTGRAIEIISLTMLVYLTFSLSTSALMNFYNARVALTER
jgi:general L-amino acid transport system permease protein